MAKDQYIARLKSVPLFAGMSKKELDLMVRQADHLRYPARYTVVREGRPGEEFWLVVEGELAVWNSEADEAICRECVRATVDRSPESVSGRSPWAALVLLILASIAASRVVTAEAGAAPIRVVDASATRPETSDRMMRCTRTSRSFGRGQNFPPCGRTSSPRPQQLSLMNPHLTSHASTIWHSLTVT